MPSPPAAKKCAMVILAAGGSVRLGAAKQLLVFEGQTLLARAVAAGLNSKCRPIFVVVGARGKQLAAEIKDLPIVVVKNLDWERGICSSIRAGVLAARETAVDAVLIYLCDQPLVGPESLNRLLDEHQKNPDGITAAFYGEEAGTPAVFSKMFFDELCALPADRGGKAVIRRHTDQVRTVPLPEAEMDVDTAEDFERLRRGKT